MRRNMRDSIRGAVLAAFVAGICGCSSYDTADGSDGDGGVSGPVNGTPVLPQLNIAKVEEVVLSQGASVSVKVTFTRGDVDGPVTLKATGLPAGVSAPEVVVPPGATDASVQLTASSNAAQGRSGFSIEATAPIAGQAPALGTASASVLVRGPSGTLDTSFGASGKLAAVLGSGLASSAIDLALYADDRIGAIIQQESASVGYAVRASRDGAMDPSFGAGGRQQLPHMPSAIGTDASDVLYTAGASGNLRTLMKLGADGKFDNDFGNSGVANLSPGGGLGIFPFQQFVINIGADSVEVWGNFRNDFAAGYWYPYQVKMARDGRSKTSAAYSIETGQVVSALGVHRRTDGRNLLASVGTFQIPGIYQVKPTVYYKGVSLVLVNADGTRDETFSAGESYNAFKGMSVARNDSIVSDPANRSTGVLVGPDQSFYVPVPTTAGVALVHFKATGQVDLAYGAGGSKDLPSTAGAFGQSVAFGKDGFLVAMAGLHSIRLAKFDFQGILDRNFGSDGIATYAFGDSVETQGARMAIQSDGRIVVLTTAVGSTKDAVLLRFWN